MSKPPQISHLHCFDYVRFIIELVYVVVISDSPLATLLD
jgi:hypothetical protein